MLERYSEESEKIIQDIVHAIKTFDADALGDYFDELYLKLDSDFGEYCWYLDSEATDQLEEEIGYDAAYNLYFKVSAANSRIGRPRSYYEREWQGVGIT